MTILVRITFLAVVIAASLVFTSSTAMACANVYESKLPSQLARHKRAARTTASYLDRIKNAGLGHTYWQDLKSETEQQKLDDFESRVNYAAALLHLGDVADAIVILEAAEEEQPGEYIVAANLGTAYELSGQDEKALEWINKGIERNPHSHEGTEWLHVKILEAKLQLAQNPNWLKTNSVLGVNFGTADKPVAPDEFVDHQGNWISKTAVREALIYQLGERVQFVKPKDPVVAALLFDLGNIVAVGPYPHNSIPFYEFAAEYGVARPELLESRLAHMEELAVVARPHQVTEYTLGLNLYAGVLGVLACSLLLFMFQRWRRVRETNTASLQQPSV